ncbi:MAG: DUF4153 domain-containing protein [Eubacteriales bacterium]|nr:DUF4153 domain-containing protein [Eubacteriales bacterium]
MNSFGRSIALIFKGSAKAFKTFPMAVACALAFSIVTMIRIQLEWSDQEAWNLLFNSLHWSFAVGAFFSLAVTTAAQTRLKQAWAFLVANLSGFIVTGATFLILYFASTVLPVDEYSRYDRLSVLAIARATSAIVISIMVFIMLAGWPKTISDYSRALFMTLKAFFIALLYGGVIMSGSSGVAGAVQALLYHNMSYKVYQYLGTIVGFLAFTIFIGFFPDFRLAAQVAALSPGAAVSPDEKREAAQRQPRFIEILFDFILIPISLALTVVFLIWTARTLIQGMGASFVQLAGIASSYAVSGLLLHILVARHEVGLAKFYRNVFPIAALIILGFEAWALVRQLQTSGLKLTEYAFALVWILTVIAVTLLLIQKEKSHLTIAILACALVFLAMLPGVGYHALPVTAQVSRLENLLQSQGLLTAGQITPATQTPDQATREAITDAVYFLASQEDGRLPAWFDKKLSQGDVFKTKLGFEQTWPTGDTTGAIGTGYLNTSLMMPSGSLDVSDYQWAIYMSENYGAKQTSEVSLLGKQGDYQLYWTLNQPSGAPTLKITRGDLVVVEETLNAYIDQIQAKYPPSNKQTTPATLDDLTYRIETPELTVLLVFGNIDITVDVQQDYINYWLNLKAIYLMEK